MRSKRSYFWILSAMLAMPLAAVGVRAGQNQGGGPGGPGGPRGARRGPMTPDDRLKEMTKDFDLTVDQQTKIKPILVDEQKKMEDLRNGSSGDRQATRGKMTQIFQDTSSQIRALLDDKQQAKFDKMQQDRQDRMGGRRGRGPGGPGGLGGGPGGDDQGGPPPQN